MIVGSRPRAALLILCAVAACRGCDEPGSAPAAPSEAPPSDGPQSATPRAALVQTRAEEAGGRIVAAAWSDDGRLAVARASGAIDVFGPDPTVELSAQIGGRAVLAWAGDALWWAEAGAGGVRVARWAGEGPVVAELTTLPGRPVGVVVDPSGSATVLVRTDAGGALYTVPAPEQAGESDSAGARDSGASALRAEVGAGPVWLARTASGVAAVTHDARSVTWVTQAGRVVTMSVDGRPVAAASSGHVLAIGSLGEDRVDLVDVVEGGGGAVRGVSVLAMPTALCADASRVVSLAGGSGEVAVVDTEAAALVARSEGFGLPVACVVDGADVWIADAGPTPTLWLADAATLEVRTSAELSGRPSWLWASSGAAVTVSPQEGRAHWWTHQPVTP